MTEPATQDTGSRIDEFLHLLGNDVRMSIMRSLWDEFNFDRYVTQNQDPTPFSTLFEQSPSSDSGNFNYHLKQLTDVLIESIAGGYVLTPLGFNLMHTIDQYTTFEYREVEPTPLDTPCPFCDGTLEGSYERELVGVTCRDCGGLGEEGNVTFVRIPANGVKRLDLSELLDIATMKLEQRVGASMYGRCWECNYPTERSISICDDHHLEPNGNCGSCQARIQADVAVHCPNCGLEGHGPVLEYALLHYDVRSLLRSKGYGPAEVGHWQRRLAGLSTYSEQVLDPSVPLIEYRFHIEDADVSVRIRGDESVRFVRGDTVVD